jgi:hypothetical protein
MACHLLLRFELPLVCSDGPGGAPTRRAEHTESRAEHCVWRITEFLRIVGPNGLEPSSCFECRAYFFVALNFASRSANSGRC